MLLQISASVRNGVIVFFVSLFACSVVSSDVLPRVVTPKFMSVSKVTSEALNFGGLKVASYAFKSSEGNKEIVKFYKKLWKGRIKSVQTPGWIYHTNFDGKYLTSIQVRDAKGSSMESYGGGSVKVSGFIGISEPGAVKGLSKKEMKVELFYPMASGVRKLSDFSAIDMGKKSRTTVYDSPGSVLSNLHHYKSHFERKGWQEAYTKMATEMVKNFGGASLIMQKGSDELVLSFIPDDNGRTKIVGVHVEK